jgi:hypothetical protein
MVIPAYIEARIRCSPPEGSFVVRGSTPVLAFGDARKARVATLGLNPSRIEFIDKRRGVLLEGNDRRLATHDSLGLSDLTTAPSDVIHQVVNDCNSYFQRRPYREWFDILEPILTGCGASYYNGTACHLDLVQWATNPTWAKLPSVVRKKLIVEDAGFLYSQLQNENIRLLLVNGAAVWQQMKRAMQDALHIAHTEFISGLSRVPTRLESGTLLKKIFVVAWSTNLQSSFGVTTALRKELACRAAHLTAHLRGGSAFLS